MDDRYDVIRSAVRIVVIISRLQIFDASFVLRRNLLFKNLSRPSLFGIIFLRIFVTYEDLSRELKVNERVDPKERKILRAYIARYGANSSNVIAVTDTSKRDIVYHMSVKNETTRKAE